MGLQNLDRRFKSDYRLSLPSYDMPTWRNWQTRWTQNPMSFTGRVGSTPTVGILSSNKSVKENLEHPRNIVKSMFLGCSLF